MLQDLVDWIRNASQTVEATRFALSRPFHPDSFPNAVQDAPSRKLQMKIYRVLRFHAPEPPPASLVRARVKYWTKEVPRRDQMDRLVLLLNLIGIRLPSFCLTATVKTMFNAWPTSKRFRCCAG
eukprot:1886226-Pyramimonas_sp.AAC.1